MNENKRSENDSPAGDDNNPADGVVVPGKKQQWVSPELRTASIALTADQGGFGGDMSTSTS